MPLLTAADFPGINAVPDKSGLARGIQNAFQGIAQAQILKAQQDREQQALDTAKKLDINASLALSFRDLASESGDPKQRQAGYQRQKAAISRTLRKMLEQGEDISLFEKYGVLDAETPDDLNVRLMKVMGESEKGRDFIFESELARRKEQFKQVAGGSGGLASAKTEILPNGSVIQAMPDGSVQVRDPEGNLVEGQARIDAINASKKFELDKLEEESKIAVEKARGVAGAQGREQRISDLQTEMSGRAREAGRQEVKLRNAETLVAQATQVLGGAAKMQAARIFPGIDVSNEGALQAAFTDLALDALQRLKGPSTDFEFVKMESIGGSISNPQTANKARIKSLQRNNWFIKRESDQFRRFVQAGGDPDSFIFNFGEPVRTKKGVFTLQDLQDTAAANNISIDDVLQSLNK